VCSAVDVVVFVCPEVADFGDGQGDLSEIVWSVLVGGAGGSGAAVGAGAESGGGHGGDGEGRCGEGGVTADRFVGSDLGLVEAEVVFRQFKTLFHRPTESGGADEEAEGDLLSWWGPAVVEGELPGGAVLADQERVTGAVGVEPGPG